MCISQAYLFFFFTPPAPTELYTLSLHDALPISRETCAERLAFHIGHDEEGETTRLPCAQHTDDVGMLQSDRKSTRLNSSHVAISYAVFCLKKKKKLRHPPLSYIQTAS